MPLCTAEAGQGQLFACSLYSISLTTQPIKPHVQLPQGVSVPAQALQKAEERASTLEMQSRSQVGGMQGPGSADGQAEDAQDLSTRNKLLMVRSLPNPREQWSGLGPLPPSHSKLARAWVCQQRTTQLWGG